jgi:hypothetical protein
MRYATCDARYNNKTLKKCKPLPINVHDFVTTLKDWMEDVDEVGGLITLVCIYAFAFYS